MKSITYIKYKEQKREEEEEDNEKVHNKILSKLKINLAFIQIRTSHLIHQKMGNNH